MNSQQRQTKNCNNDLECKKEREKINVNFFNAKKIELHAHLSGSVRESTVFELLGEEDEQVIEMRHKNKRTLAECFLLFPIIHRALNSPQVLAQVTREVLQDFEAENCVYLELRTTPKPIKRVDPATGVETVLLSKEGYLETVLNVIREYEEADGKKMIVRLLISIDRSRGVDEAIETLDLVLKYKNDTHIVGIDFSGTHSYSLLIY